MKRIDSSANGRYKLWKSLLEKKGRDSEGCFLIEGDLLISEALEENQAIEAIILKEGTEGEEEYEKGEVFLLKAELFHKLSRTEHGRNVMACVRKPAWTRESIRNKLSGKEALKNILVLDRIQDPGNLGTLIRTADAAGFSGIALLKGTCDPFSPKVVRAAAGSVMRMPILEVDSPEELIKLVKELSLRLVATGFEKSRAYTEEDFTDAAIVIGNEGAGVSGELLEAADSTVNIPMSGNIDSLNAGVAGAIIMYECVRQKTFERG